MSNPNPRYFRSRGGWIIAFKGVQVISPTIPPGPYRDAEVIVTFKSGRLGKMSVLADEVEPLMTAFERWLSRL